MSMVEQEIIEHVRKLDEAAKQRVLDFVLSLETNPLERPYALHELMALPYEQRTRLAAEALARSQNDDVELFDAYDADFDDE